MSRAIARAAVIGSTFTACEGAGGSASTDPLLVGKWSYAGNDPFVVSAMLTLRSDKTFSFVENVQPVSIPAGTVLLAGCVTTDTYLGTYAASITGGTKTLTWTFESGIANAVVGCANSADNRSGTPMTAEAVASYQSRNFVPPTTVTYEVTPTRLVLAPNVTDKAGLSGESPFTKIQ
jgi:hypothetical protein